MLLGRQTYVSKVAVLEHILHENLGYLRWRGHLSALTEVGFSKFGFLIVQQQVLDEKKLKNLNMEELFITKKNVVS